MPTSFDALHEETRPRALLDTAPPRHSPAAVTFLCALALLLPVLIVVLL